MLCELTAGKSELGLVNHCKIIKSIAVCELTAGKSELGLVITVIVKVLL